MSDPERDRSGLARMGLERAPLTAAILVANVAVYIGQLAVVRSAGVLSGIASNPIDAARLTQGSLAFGANYPPFVFGEHRVETLLTSCFVHFSLMHIAFNMAALRQMGGIVERTVGQARLASMYVVSGILGSATSAAWGWFVPGQERVSAGASGAICGVLGAALVLGIRLQGWRGPIVRAMLFWLAIVIGLGFALHSDNSAHIGGAIGGAAFATAWRPGVVYSRGVARGIVAGSIFLVLACGATVLARDLLDPWATLDVDSRIARAADALNGASCRDAAISTERAARIAPRSERVRELKRAILVGCRPSP